MTTETQDTEIKTEEQLERLEADPVKLREFIKASVGESLKEHGVKRLPMTEEVADPPPGQTAVQWQGVDKAKSSIYRDALALNGQFKGFGEFLTTIFPAYIMQSGVDARHKVLSEGDGASGGFTVPEEFRAQLLALALEDAVVRPRAFTMPMASNTVRIPAIRDTSHATNVFGGVQAYWTPESGALTASEPTFAQLQLVAKKLTGYTTASNELLADSAIGLEALIMRLFSQALTFFEEEAFINGSGAGEPEGILNATALVSQAAEAGQVAATIVYENLAKMYSRMLPASLGRAVWLAHPDVFPQLATLSLAVGTGGSAVWIGNGGAVGGPPATIFGRPVIFTEHCQALGTVGDIYFADFSYYVIGDRQALTMAASPHVRFTNDETVWRFTQRLDGKCWLDSALVPRYGSNSRSPFVALASR